MFLKMNIIKQYDPKNNEWLRTNEWMICIIYCNIITSFRKTKCLRSALLRPQLRSERNWFKINYHYVIGCYYQFNKSSVTIGWQGIKILKKLFSKFKNSCHDSFLCNHFKSSNVHDFDSQRELIVTSIVQLFGIAFQVMIQKHNRHMSFSLYISALAVSDTVALISGTFISTSNCWIYKSEAMALILSETENNLVCTTLGSLWLAKNTHIRINCI